MFSCALCAVGLSPSLKTLKAVLRQAADKVTDFPLYYHHHHHHHCMCVSMHMRTRTHTPLISDPLSYLFSLCWGLSNLWGFGPAMPPAGIFFPPLPVCWSLCLVLACPSRICSREASSPSSGWRRRCFVLVSSYSRAMADSLPRVLFSTVAEETFSSSLQGSSSRFKN